MIRALIQSSDFYERVSDQFENWPNLSFWLATFWTITSPVLPINVAIPYDVLKNKEQAISLAGIGDGLHFFEHVPKEE